MPAGFDVHEVRHRVKLLRDDGHTMLIENREGVACPACGDAFSQLLISARPAHSFDFGAGTRVCIRREDARLLVATHE
jgi:hypothetical protein